MTSGTIRQTPINTMMCGQLQQNVVTTIQIIRSQWVPITGTININTTHPSTSTSVVYIQREHLQFSVRIIEYYIITINHNFKCTCTHQYIRSYQHPVHNIIHQYRVNYDHPFHLVLSTPYKHRKLCILGERPYEYHGPRSQYITFNIILNGGNEGMDVSYDER